MLDSDVVSIYRVPTEALNRAVRRNAARFPEDFVLRLTADELERLKCQIGISNKPGRGGRRYLPYAFTEHGAIMAASVLSSGRAVEMSVFVVRAFVQMRQTIQSHKDLSARLSELERAVGGHDAQIRNIVDAIKRLMQPPTVTKPPIGFRIDDTPRTTGRRRKEIR